MSQDVGVASADFIKSSPDVLRGLVKGRREAVDFIYKNLDEAAQIVSKRYGNTLPSDIAPTVMKRMADIQYWSPGNIEMESLETVVDAMKMQGKWTGPVDWNKIIDRSFLPADLRSKT